MHYFLSEILSLNGCILQSADRRVEEKENQNNGSLYGGLMVSLLDSDSFYFRFSVAFLIISIFNLFILSSLLVARHVCSNMITHQKC